GRLARRGDPGAAPPCESRRLPGGGGGQFPGHGRALPRIPARAGRHVPGAAADRSGRVRHPHSCAATHLAGDAQLHPAIHPAAAAPGAALAHPPGIVAGRRADPLGKTAFRGRRATPVAGPAAHRLQARQWLQRTGNCPEAQRHREGDAARQPGAASPASARRRLQHRGALVPVPELRLAGGPAMISRLDLDALQAHLAGTPLQEWTADLPGQIDAKLAVGHGDLQRWYGAVQALPDLPVSEVELAQRFAFGGACDEATRAQLKTALQGLIPWRKGPFELFDVHVDTEWRSDWKWQRVAPHLDLRGKRILDVGCGNGYYMWRMLGAGAGSVVGIDPNWLFLCQFLAIKNYLPDEPVWHLPLAFEELPARLQGFDTVFSMGVLYHRRSPIDHLLDL